MFVAQRLHINLQRHLNYIRAIHIYSDKIFKYITTYVHLQLNIEFAFLCLSLSTQLSSINT